MGALLFLVVILDKALAFRNRRAMACIQSPVKILARYLWPLGWTAVGLVCALPALALGARARWHQGVLEVCGGRLQRGCAGLPPALRFEAMTLGHVVLGLSATDLAAVRAHERVHVAQYERWGLLFVPAYLAESAWQWARGRDPYRHNRFECAAYHQPPGLNEPAAAMKQPR